MHSGSAASNPTHWFSVDVWVPLTAGALDRGWRPDPNISWLHLLVRLRDGVDPSRARAMFEAAFRTHVADVLLPSASPRFKQMLEAQRITVRPAASGLATTGRKYEKRSEEHTSELQS